MFALCFDVNNKDSYVNVTSQWQKELKKYCPVSFNVPQLNTIEQRYSCFTKCHNTILLPFPLPFQDVPVILVGTKTDLRNDGGSKWHLTHKDGVTKSNEIGAYEYVECSALTQVLFRF